MTKDRVPDQISGQVPGQVSGPKVSTTEGLPQWLHKHNISLGFTARQTNKLFLAGINPDGGLSFFERTFDNASGLTVSQNSLFVSTLFQIWHLNNSLLPGQTQDGYDRVYLPRTAYTTGNCATHEMRIDASNRLIFVNTRFSCLATLSSTHSFKPVWKPAFITELLPEDRCHLNSMALDKNGHVSLVTVCAVSNEKDGWRNKREDGGCLIDVKTNTIISKGLSMPHSPRIHNNKIWLLNSGHGQIGTIDPKTGDFSPLIACPGFLRGLEFIDHYAIVTVSKPRVSSVFSGLPLEKMMDDQQFTPECGILIIDLHSKKIVHRIRIDTIIEELMDVAVLPGCQRPMLMGLKPDEIKNVFSIEPFHSPKEPDVFKNPILV